MKDSPTENPKRPRNISALLKAAIWGAVFFGFSLAFLWWAKRNDFFGLKDFDMILGVTGGVISLVLALPMNLILSLTGLNHTAFIQAHDQILFLINNTLIGMIIGYWSGRKTKNCGQAK
jgi:hypothetical protein